jgi:tRNA pseudouridine13 synthase
MLKTSVFFSFIMYALKQVPEDFIVEEVIELPKSKAGKFSYFSLKKRSLNSEEAIQAIAAHLKKPRKLFAYAGSKDKHAVTTQYCSFMGSMADFALPGLEVKVIGKGDEAIHLGRHTANRFVITIRNLTSSDLELFKKNYELLQERGFRFANYFDAQRFSGSNPEVGKAMIKKDFAAAAQLISGHGEIWQYLEEHPKDYVGALRRLPQKTLQLYIHAYQSKLWNMLADKTHSKKNIKLPLIGFGTEHLSKAAEDLLKAEGIALRDFIIRQLPVSAEGHERELYASASDFKILATGDDERNSGKSKITLSFTLPKASYATMLIKGLFQPK